MKRYCNGIIDCPWLTPNDEANCSDCGPILSNTANKCKCNQVENFTCEFDPSIRARYTCYIPQSKYFCDKGS